MAQFGASSGGGGGNASTGSSSSTADQQDAESGRSSGVMGSNGTHANQNGGINNGVGLTLGRPSSNATTIIGGSSGPASPLGNNR